MSVLAGSPIRRSPIDGAGDGRAAHPGHPPAGPGDGTAVIEDLAPLDKVVAYGLREPAAPGRVVRTGPVAVWHVGPDEAIIVAPPANAATASTVAGARSVVDVSSGYAALELHGPGARDVLASACAVDLGADAVPDGSIVQAVLANVRVILGRSDRDDATAFTILVARDEARYLWDALVSLGAAPGPKGGDR